MNQAAERRAAPTDVGASMVRWGMASTAVCSLLAAPVSWLVDRSWGSALTGVLGAALTGVTLTTGVWAVRWLLQQDRAIVLPGAFMIAICQLALLFALVLVLRQQDWWNDATLAVGALVSAVGIQVALVLAYVTGRKPELEVEPW